MGGIMVIEVVSRITGTTVWLYVWCDNVLTTGN
jgi:hypothetical protein